MEGQVRSSEVIEVRVYHIHQYIRSVVEKCSLMNESQKNI